MVESIEKLGEGTFAEVFGCVNEDGDILAIKVSTLCCMVYQLLLTTKCRALSSNSSTYSVCAQIIPVEGQVNYNDEPQSSFSDTLNELVIIR